MSRSPNQTRFARLRPQLRRILELAHLREVSAEGVALRAGVPPGRFPHLLSLLRGLGLATTLTLYRPERVGCPLHVRTLVRLRSQEPRVRDGFERLCLRDPWVAWASSVSGEYDYLLIGHHRDLRTRDAWLRVLASQPEVGGVESQILDVRFGHMLPGAVITGVNDDAPGPPTQRRGRAR